ncbi:Crp/Fnr family transcriptional regulator [Clostridium aminobutyricum]|uniref:Crp/Fnr family transcriptional regulator n=1 Tax=Clostridium aminobutyricum TaxID=33953 RepID=A0A939D8W0_CLOAM|nr:Crp/Fnr family transcriptional regulator [Clostridium aminobutyricum]MBN7773372.1 Crp/Fnr family transcriptional regulator [Clostridium aminobutyricum]
MNIVKKEEIIKKYPFVERLIQSMPEDIWEKCSLITYKAGEKIFYQGADLTKVYLICDGTVSVFENDLSGREMQVVFLEKGGVVGEMEALIKGRTMRFSAKTVTRCTLISMSVSTFIKWTQRDIGLCLILIESLAKKIQQASNEIVLHVQSSAIEMLSSRLIFAEAGLLRVTRNELAQRCGVSVRTINRCVQKLAEEGYITMNHRKIYISNEQKGMLAQSPYVNQFRTETD